MSVGQSQLWQHLSHNTVQNGSQGVFGSVQNLYLGNTTSSEETNEKKGEECRNALFISYSNVDREELISAKGIRVSGTCEWIKEDENFRALENGEISLLWITGEPGKGKTMLSIFITEDLEETYPKIKEGEVIYHFCVHKKSDTGTALLRGLLYQILDKRRELTKDVLSYFDTPEKTQQALSSLETLWTILLKLIKHPKLGVMLCVLDGLDECDEDTRRFLLPRFVQCFGSSQPAVRTRFKLIIVSRALEGLEECKKIDLDNDPESRGRRDMKLFVREKVDELFRKKKFDDSFRPVVESALLSKAGDTFLWVGFVVNDLLKLRTWSQVQEQLESLPDGLSSIYGRMLLKIPPKERETSLSILQWVCLARRPLSLLALAEMMALQQQQRVPGPITFTRPKKVPDFIAFKQEAKDAIGLCGDILKLKNEEVTFVHKTARDFLLRKEKEDNKVLRLFRLKRKKTHLLLAQACFQSIAQSNLCISTVYQDPQLPSRSSPFLRYAFRYWPAHVQRCRHKAGDLFEDFCSVFESNPNLSGSWYYYRTEHSLDDAYNIQAYNIPLLHLVSYLGIGPWIEALLRKNSSIPDFVNEKDENGMMPLDWAFRGNNKEAVDILLAHTADINDTGSYECLLQQGVLWRNQRILKMLSERGVDFSLRNFFGETWLHTVILFGMEMEKLKLLVEMGADLKSMDKQGRTPLHLAAEKGREEMALFLIEAGADIMTKDRDRQTVLQAACSSKMERVVRQLLRMGLDVKAKDKFNNTVLHKVARTRMTWKDQAIARLLISKGADVQAENCLGWTPLHVAATSGNPTLVRLFIEYGAEVNARTRLGNMPSHFALSFHGYGELARLLISKGADVNAPDDRGRIPLEDCIRKHEPDYSAIQREAGEIFSRCFKWEIYMSDS